MEEGKKNLLGKTIGELQSAVTELGMPKFTALQICEWLYQNHVKSIDEMTTFLRLTVKS